MAVIRLDETVKEQQTPAILVTEWFSNALSALMTDTCYILSFAIIMLNTSLHNPNVKDKTSLERFISMNRGINNGEDLPNELLTVKTEGQSQTSLMSACLAGAHGNKGDDFIVDEHWIETNTMKKTELIGCALICMTSNAAEDVLMSHSK